jgi:hypothetical protein
MRGFLTNIWADLVEKRLWPLALVLVLALLAVPTLLAKGPAEEALGPESPAVAAAAGGETKVIALDVDGASGPRNGALGRNPFEQLFVPKPKPAAEAEQAGADSGNPGKAGGGEGGDTTSGAKGEPAPATTPKATKTTYKANLRFGEAGAMKTVNDIARLTPLPSAANPFFVFLGVKDRGETLVFLVSSDAKATGDGTCKPSASQCETIELKAGETEFFDVSTDEGIRQYQLDVLSIKKVTTVSTGAAKQANARVSQAGAELLRDAGSDGLQLGSYRWTPGLGELVTAQP